MNRTAIALILLAFVVALGACSAKDSGMKAPSSSAYGNAADGWKGAAAEERGERYGGRLTDGEARARNEATGRADGSTPREVMVRAERERAAAPLVPAFPAGMRRKVLQDMVTVFFAFDSTRLTAATHRQLDANAAWMRANPHVVVRLMGHADERGTSEYNLGLGLRRANQARDYLLNKGIPDERMVTVSFGEELPLRRGHDEAAWAGNRRVEFGLGKSTAQR